ncbi:MAG TPA: glycosyltransferase family 2 protein, partial [Euryarchaeota archaeon]|nr:glycosyltransferase family 2 protein [Euryarchaeota archaeon]
MKICVIPAFNEERAIGGIVTKTSEYVDKIVVVDDGSVDKTSDIAGKAGAEVVRLDINTGKANAVREGLRLCSGYDAVIIMDGDGQHLPGEIPVLLEKL